MPVTEPPIPLCRDCKYFADEYRTHHEPYMWRKDGCRHPRLVDPVHGDPVYCSSKRLMSGECGISGYWFVAK